MLIGHYAPALLAKAVEPDIPLWSTVLAAQWLDVLWVLFNAAGIEQVKLPKVPMPGWPAIAVYIPWTHSLPMAVMWSVMYGLTARRLRASPRQSVILSLTVASHWIADLLVHRRDLSLFFYGPKYGCNMWSRPVAEATFEMSLLGLGAIAWTGSRLRRNPRAGITPVVLFFTILSILQFYGQYTKPPLCVISLLTSGITTYLGCTILAAIIDKY